MQQGEMCTKLEGSNTACIGSLLDGLQGQIHVESFAVTRNTVTHALEVTKA